MRLVEGSPAAVHPEMLEAAGDGVLWLVGGGQLASQLVDHGLLDDLLLTLVPAILGDGIPLFARPVPGQLQLTRTRELPGGLVENSYELPNRVDAAT